MAQALREPTRHASRATDAAGNATQASPLQASLQNLLETMSERAMTSVSDRLTGATERLTDYAQEGGGGLLSAVTGVESPIKSVLGAGLSSTTEKVTDSLKGVAGSLLGSKGKGGGKGGDKVKVTNIVEQIDVGVPIDLAYQQWTLFSEFPKFMKKVESVDQVSDEKLQWKAQVFWSHRTWESTITEQVPNERIVWRSKGDKGYVDGAVTFHELAPDLTRVIVVLEYHPKGLFERTGNLWRAQGRRVRLELKHFQRHVMTNTVLHADEIEGWQGEIRDSEVVSDSNSDSSSEDEEAAQPKRHRTAQGGGSSATGQRRATKAAGSSSSPRRPAAKSTSSSDSGRRTAAKATTSGSSGRRRAAKGTTSTQRRTPPKQRSRK
jgi:uncharacterized membrane protein